MLKKFLLSYALLCILPFLLLGLTFSSLTEKIVTSELMRNARSTLKDGNRTISTIISETERMTYRMSNDTAIQEALLQMKEGNLDNGSDSLQKAVEIYNSFSPEYLNVEVSVFLPQELYERWEADFAHGNKDVSLIRAYPDNYSEPWYLNCTSQENQYIWSEFYNGEATVLRQAKVINGGTAKTQNLGIAATDIAPGQIHSIALQLGRNNHQFYLVEKNGAILYPYYNYHKIPDDILSSTKESDYTLLDKLILVSPLRGTSWKLIIVLPTSELIARTHSIRTILSFIAVLFTVFSLCVAAYFSLHIFQPISILTKKMREMRAGDLKDLTMEKTYPGEIGELYSSFNYMIDRINQQIGEIYLAQIREKDSELRALQAQINPHFLYNTLDSINWLALRCKAYDISRMVCSLSDMLRMSLNKGRIIISLEDELRQVKSYVTLQQMRYSDKFEFFCEVSPHLLKIRIIKMLLQPLVENAIIHGFEEFPEKGEIHVCIQEIEHKMLHFQVRNNGKLIDLEAMKHKLCSSEKDMEKQRGYGVRNVNDRIHAYYGDEYSILYSIQGTFTIAEFIIPMEVTKNGTDFNRG